MSLSNFSKSWIFIVSTFGVVAVSNSIAIDTASAFGVTFNNGGFENTTGNSPNNWSTIGDVTTNTGIDGVNPVGGSRQAIITNAYKIESSRNDDNSYTFNQSGTNPVDADTITTNHTGNDLQTSLNLNTNALSIDRSPAVSGFPRTSKEGSGMYQDISISISSTDVANGTNGFNINFNWAYLTNDGRSDDLGNQDYSFISINNTSNPVQVLGDSDQTITAPTANNDFVRSNTTYYSTNNNYTRSITGLAEGTYNYRVGFGVVDVDGSDLSSALIIDNFNVQQVPFEFSPGLGLGIVAVMFGCDRLRRIRSKTVDNFSERSPINH